MKQEWKNHDERRCLNERNKWLSFIEGRVNTGKEQMEKIVNEENKWEHMVETDAAVIHMELLIQCKG